MRKLSLSIIVSLLCSTGLSQAVTNNPTASPLVEVGQQVNTEKVAQAKSVEMVFVIDTTGSMGGLIQGAKTKVWSIINTLYKDLPKSSTIKVGLVAYRDRGDQYVTQLTALSDNLDHIYDVLMKFEANGGGDTPEDVRTALNSAIQDVQWNDSSSDTTKIIFLVGDAPSHKYKEVPDTLVSASKAKEMGIIVNAIQCGDMQETKTEWIQIAKKGGGEYFAISQNGGVKEIATPFDQDLIDLNAELSATYLPYGDVASQKVNLSSKMGLEKRMKSAPLEAQAERAVNKTLNVSNYDVNDLVSAVTDENTKLKDIAKKQLPEIMQKMTQAEQEAYLHSMIEKRNSIKEKLTATSNQRNAYIKAQENVDNVDSFDQAISAALMKQIK